MPFKQTRAGFLGHTRGNVSLFFAFGAVIIFAAAGSAIDFSRIASSRAAAQADLDAAVLAAASAKTSTPAAVVQAFLDKQGNGLISGPVTVEKTATNLTVKTTATTTVPMAFMGLFGVQSVPLTITSAATAPLQAKSLEIDLQNAYGWSNKVVSVKVKRPDGTVDTLMTVTYTMTDPSGADNRGTGTTVFSPSSTITDLGDYTSLWLEMVVTEYGTGIQTTYATNDPSTSNHLWVNGTELPSGVTPNIGDILDCGETVQHAWEDSRNPAEWAQQDIFFNVTTTCSAGGANNAVHLTM